MSTWSFLLLFILPIEGRTHVSDINVNLVWQIKFVSKNLKKLILCFHVNVDSLPRKISSRRRSDYISTRSHLRAYIGWGNPLARRKRATQCTMQVCIVVQSEEQQQVGSWVRSRGGGWHSAGSFTRAMTRLCAPRLHTGYALCTALR